MRSFLDLPVELLPVILTNVLKPNHLAILCLVNKLFYQFAVTNLYKRISIYAWQKKGKSKVIQLFSTLAGCPHLAEHIQCLELREFPKPIDLDTLATVLQGLRNCLNLRSCTWTRDGSLNSDILKALQSPPRRPTTLKELEINGRSEDNYDPDILQGFTHLTRISLIMPSAPVVRRLKPWMSLAGETLQSLSLICKASPIITDVVLEDVAPYLTNLTHLYLTGCPKVTHRGVWAVISSNTAGLVGLGLESVSLKFDMEEFSQRCRKAGALSRLTSITLTVHPQLPLRTWMDNVTALLSSSPLQNFHVYSTGAFYESPSTDFFWSQLVEVHGQRLVKFSVSRMLLGLNAIEEICGKCAKLEQLFIVVEPDSLENLGGCLSQSNTLRAIHINYPLEAEVDTDVVSHIISEEDALSIIRRCSPRLTQFGCNTRVWQVSRIAEVDPDGELFTYPRLTPYEGHDVPEPFLIVR